MLSAVTRRERNAATTLASDCIDALGGWVDDVHMFSNIMTAIRFTIAEDRLPALVKALEAGGLSVDRADESPGSKETGVAERRASLQITFVHNDLDLKRDVPAVPG
jgi:hypothetical protein